MNGERWWWSGIISTNISAFTIHPSWSWIIGCICYCLVILLPRFLLLLLLSLIQLSFISVFFTILFFSISRLFVSFHSSSSLLLILCSFPSLTLFCASVCLHASSLLQFSFSTPISLSLALRLALTACMHLFLFSCFIHPPLSLLSTLWPDTLLVPSMHRKFASFILSLYLVITRTQTIYF